MDIQIRKQLEQLEYIKDKLEYIEYDEALGCYIEKQDGFPTGVAAWVNGAFYGFEQAAKAQAVPKVKPLRSITLTCAQLREAFMFGAPDKDDQEQLETEMTIVWSREGHSGKGYYCYYSDLPEEGAIFLDEVIEAQEPTND